MYEAEDMSSRNVANVLHLCEFTVVNSQNKISAFHKVV